MLFCKLSKQYVDKKGKVTLLTEIQLPENRRALLTILDKEPKHTPASKKDLLFAAFERLEKENVFAGINNPVE